MNRRDFMHAVPLTLIEGQEKPDGWLLKWDNVTETYTLKRETVILRNEKHQCWFLGNGREMVQGDEYVKRFLKYLSAHKQPVDIFEIRLKQVSGV